MLYKAKAPRLVVGLLLGVAQLDHSFVNRNCSVRPFSCRRST